MNPTTTSPALISGSKMCLNVLVVDDDDALRDELAEAITALGHTCTTAREGVQAWELHSVKGFDVILSDWMMPYMNGLELCTRVRLQAGDTYTYFIMMTSLTDRGHAVQAMRGGLDDYLTKPVDPEELEAKLRSAARITALHRGLSRNNDVLRRDGDRLRRDSDRSFKAARVDALTEAGNRLRLQEDLAVLRAKPARRENHYCAALCDVDNFKFFNDCFGHVAGDEALRKVAAAMRASLREGDALYRYGGEEFLVILPEESIEKAFAVMDRLRGDVERLAIPHAPLASHPVVTMSIGVSDLAHTSDSAQSDSLRRADAGLYRAKAAGRNRVRMQTG